MSTLEFPCVHLFDVYFFVPFLSGRWYCLEIFQCAPLPADPAWILLSQLQLYENNWHYSNYLLLDEMKFKSSMEHNFDFCYKR